MVCLLDGSSECDAHVGSILNHLIYSQHFYRSTVGSNLIILNPLIYGVVFRDASATKNFARSRIFRCGLPKDILSKGQIPREGGGAFSASPPPLPWISGLNNLFHAKLIYEPVYPSLTHSVKGVTIFYLGR